jgi:hypothetical protein
MNPTRSIFNVRTIGAVLAVALLAGCNANDRYDYDGTLLRADGHTPLSNTKFLVVPQNNLNVGPNTQDQADASDDAGNIRGSFTTTRSTIAPCHQFAPSVPSVDDYVDGPQGWMPVTVPLGTFDNQPKTSTGRQLHLGQVVVPGT